jgi:hypothetical protein
MLKAYSDRESGHFIYSSTLPSRATLLAQMEQESIVTYLYFFNKSCPLWFELDTTDFDIMLNYYASRTSSKRLS